MILIDGDILAYKCAYSLGDDGTDEDVADYIEEQLMMYFDDLLFDPSDTPEYEMYLTGKSNFRYDIREDYKGNRKGDRPKLLEAARDELVLTWGARITEGFEADDAISMRANEIGYDNVTIVSVDKDFHQMPVEMYNPRTGDLYLVENPNHNFYEQVLTGDRVDNVEGIYGVGPKKAERYLRDIPEDDVCALWNEVVAVYESYGKTKADALQTAQLLWLWREHGGTYAAPC